MQEFLWTCLLHELFFSAVFGVCILPIAPFFLQEDPVYFILKGLSPSSGFENTLAGKLLRSLTGGVLGYHWLMGGAYISATGMELAYLIPEILNCIVRDSRRWFRKCLRHRYICFSLLVHLCNNIFRWTLAVTLGGVGGVVVCGISCSIKFHVLVPTYILVAFLIVSLTMIILIGIILPNAASVHELSIEYVDTLKARALIRTSSRLEYDIRISRATQPISIECGCFTTFDKQSILIWYLAVLEQTVNVLLGF